MQVAVQCVVRHSDVAIVTAIELLMTECGAAIGSAVAGMVFSEDLPNALASRLPDLSQEDLDSIYGSLSIALSFPLGSATREAIIEAWVQVMHKLCIIATVILVPAIFLCMAIPDGTLPDILHHRMDSQYHHHHHHPRHSSRSSIRHNGRRPSSRSRPVNTATDGANNLPQMTKPSILKMNSSRPSQDGEVGAKNSHPNNICGDRKARFVSDPGPPLHIDDTIDETQ